MEWLGKGAQDDVARGTASSAEAAPEHLNRDRLATLATTRVSNTLTSSILH